MGYFDHAAGCTISGKPLAQSHSAFLPLTQPDERPAAQNHGMGGKKRQRMLGCYGKVGIGNGPASIKFATQLVERCAPAECLGSAGGVGHRSGEFDCSVAVHKGLVGIAEMPQHAGQKGVTVHSMLGVGKAEHLDAVALGVVKGEPTLEVVAGAPELGGPKQQISHYEMGRSKNPRILQLFGDAQAFFGGREPGS